MAAEDNNILDHRMCGTMEVYNRLLEEYPECRARRAEISTALEATLDDTMIMFTSGQISRMHATLEGSRSSIGS
jgi:hypothetical protein